MVAGGRISRPFGRLAPTSVGPSRPSAELTHSVVFSPARRHHKEMASTRASVGALLAVLFAGSSSHASDFEIRGGAGHVAYGVGGATGAYGGFRQNLDLALFPLLLRRVYKEVWLTAGASAMLGFDAYPSYASFEVGPGLNWYWGGIASLGPVYRFGSGKFEAGGGGQLRVSVDFMLVEVGLRMIQMVSPDRETQITFMAGVGRF